MFDVMCNVKAIYVDVDLYRGYMDLPQYNVPDMSSTIRCFKEIDPEIKRIDVFVEDKLDIVYLVEDGEWVAKRPAQQQSCTAKT